MLFFGTKKQYPSVAHHTISLGPRYEGLLKDIFQHKILADDFSLYLHRPTATDTSFAPEGCDSFYALVPVPNLQGGQDWTTLGRELQDKVLDNLDKTILPDVNRHSTMCFIKHHLIFKGAPQSRWRSIFSCTNILPVCMVPLSQSGRGTKNLYLVGAGTPWRGPTRRAMFRKVVDHLPEKHPTWKMKWQIQPWNKP